MKTASIKITGGRGTGVLAATGRDIKVTAEIDGKEVLLPVTSMTLTVRDRKSTATVVLDVDAVEVDSIEIECIRRDMGIGRGDKVPL